MKRILLLLPLVVVVASLVAYGQLVAPGTDNSPKVGDKAPDFSLPATTAEAIKLADYVGKKPVVVFFYLAAFNSL